MNLALVTIFSSEHETLHELTAPSKRAYAARWGHRFLEIRMESAGRTVWARPSAWLNLMASETADWLWILGTDVMLTSLEVDAGRFCGPNLDLAICADQNGINNDSFFIRRCERSRDFLSDVCCHAGAPHDPARPFVEQDAMSVVLAGERSFADYVERIGRDHRNPNLEAHLNKTAMRVRIHHPKDFNAYPTWLYQGAVDEGHRWAPGMLALHLPGIPLERRVAFFRSFT